MPDDSPDKIKWHPAFGAAIGIEFREDIEILQLHPEYYLSKEPIRIDLLVIKDKSESGVLKNQIGHIMRKYNVMEYKSPRDSMSIDDFYKAMGYACLYKGYGETVNQVPSEELTISMFRQAYPRKLFGALKREGHELEERYPGIYYVGGFPFPAQVVVTGQLDKEMHSSLRVLSDHADRDDVERFLMQARQMTSPGDRNNIDSILQVSAAANFALYEEVRRDSVMCQVMRELMKEEIAEERNEGRAEGRAEGRTDATVDAIKNLMKNLKYSAEQAMDALEVPLQKRDAYIAKL